MTKDRHDIPDEIERQRPDIAVGDLIQYRYSYGPKGFTQWGITTRSVIEVIDGGARFKVDGDFIVFAKQITTHIEMKPRDEVSATPR
jgi:hypothetical protein